MASNYRCKTRIPGRLFQKSKVVIAKRVSRQERAGKYAYECQRGFHKGEDRRTDMKGKGKKFPKWVCCRKLEEKVGVSVEK